MTAGNFREDLFFRLNVVNISLPALRERPEDIPLLVASFVQKYNRKMGCSVLKIAEEAFQALVRHEYRGNVRELENIIEKTLVFLSGEVISLDDLPQEVRCLMTRVSSTGDIDAELIPVRLGHDLPTIQKSMILTTLKYCGGDKQKSAEMLKISERKLWYKLKDMANMNRV